MINIYQPSVVRIDIKQNIVHEDPLIIDYIFDVVLVWLYVPNICKSISIKVKHDMHLVGLLLRYLAFCDCLHISFFIS